MCLCHLQCALHSSFSQSLPLFELWFKLWVGGGVDTRVGLSRECARCPIHSTRVLLRCSMHKKIVSTASRHVSSPPLEYSNVRVSGFRAPESNGRIIVQSTSSHSHPPSLPPLVPRHHPRARSRGRHPLQAISEDQLLDGPVFQILVRCVGCASFLLRALCRCAPATSKHRKLLAEWATPALVCPSLSLHLCVARDHLRCTPLFVACIDLRVSERHLVFTLWSCLLLVLC